MKKVETEVKATRSDIFMIPVNQIVIPEDFNKRVDYGDITSLKNSILESGQKNPLRVKKIRGEEKYVLIDGFRRMRAINEAIAEGKEFLRVLAIAVPADYSDEQKILDIILCNDGKPLTMFEFGQVCDKLKNLGWNPSKIAQKVGKSLPYVIDSMKVVNLPEELQISITQNDISAKTVLEIVKITPDDETKQKQLVKDAISKAKATGKTKATAKNVTALKDSAPVKKLEDLKEYLAANGIKNDKTALLAKLVSRLKSKQSIESLSELFTDNGKPLNLSGDDDLEFVSEPMETGNPYEM